MLLPSKTNIIEVGPRDGFQNNETLIPTEIKIKIIGSLIESGIKEMEITSFVHPKLIPQMSDASEVVKHITKRYGGVFRPIALVPNIKGAENALKAGIRTITYVLC